MRFVRRLLFLLLFLVIGALCVVWVGAFTSLDRTMQHTQETASLQFFSQHHAAGLVQIKAGSDVFRARIAGFTNPAAKGNLILLHGFPETSVMWDALIPAAADAGYRVIAFDQRGYSPGARPAGRSSYTTDILVKDVLAIADATGFEQFHLVGHDWGAGIGWLTVLTNPERVLTWTALSIPHIASFGEALRDDLDQQRKSAYMGFFWLPWLAEQVFAFNDFDLMRNAMYQDHPATHVAEYIKVFAEPGALTGALNWYRAGSEGGSGSMQVSTPTLFIWGNSDPAVGRAGVDGQGKFMQGPFKEIELDTGHWLMATASERVISEVLEHIRD